MSEIAWSSLFAFEELEMKINNLQSWGLLKIKEILQVNKHQNFPERIEIWIEFQQGKFGLLKWETLDGCYIVSGSSFNQTHYWLPCHDNLHVKCKWKITLVSEINTKLNATGLNTEILELPD